MTTKRNIADASKDELIMIVKQLHSRVAALQSSVKSEDASSLCREFEERVRSLEEQNALLKDELLCLKKESTKKLEELNRLKEKSAADEETIHALIQQVESGCAASSAPVLPADISTSQLESELRDSRNRVLELSEVVRFFEQDLLRSEDASVVNVSSAVVTSDDEVSVLRSKLRACRVELGLKQAENEVLKRRVKFAHELSDVVIALSSASVEEDRHSNDECQKEVTHRQIAAIVHEGNPSTFSTESESQTFSSMKNTDSYTHLDSVAPSQPKQEFAFPPLQIRGATPREKKILERLKAVEEHLRVVLSQEALRQEKLNEATRNQQLIVQSLQTQLDKCRHDHVGVTHSITSDNLIVTVDHASQTVDCAQELACRAAALEAEKNGFEERFRDAVKVAQSLRQKLRQSDDRCAVLEQNAKTCDEGLELEKLKCAVLKQEISLLIELREATTEKQNLLFDHVICMQRALYATLLSTSRSRTDYGKRVAAEKWVDHDVARIEMAFFSQRASAPHADLFESFSTVEPTRVVEFDPFA